MKYIFLDRDGVINEEVNFLTKKEQLKLIPNAAEAIALLNKEGYKVIVITNQPVIARGMCSEKDIEEIHQELQHLLSEKNAHIDAFYYCPHHPIVGINPHYTKDCECRKPKPGMILKAKKDFKIPNLSRCFFIGDKIGDIKAGNFAECKTILLETGYGGKEIWNDANPTYHSQTLYTSVKEIVLK